MSRPLISLIALSAAALAATAQAQAPALVRPAKAVERAAAIMSIQAQLKAFGRNDYKTAITYQSSGLKKSFPSAQVFRSMILQVYPEFAHTKRVVFGPAQTDKTGVHLAIPTAVTGIDDVTVHAVYLMVREGKIYRVEGVAGGAPHLPSEDDGVPSKDV